METFDNNFGAPFSKLCRTCLRPKEGMKPVYDSNITNMLMFGASIKVETGDGMPGNICLTCLRQVNRSCSFKNLCEKSDSILRRYVMYGCLPPEDILKIESSQQETRIMDDHVEPIPEDTFVNDTANLLEIQASTNIPDHNSEDDEGALTFLELGLEPECNLIENALADMAALKGGITLAELPNESDSPWLQQTDSIVLDKGSLDVGSMISFSMITDPDDGCIQDIGNNNNKEKTIPCPECIEKFATPEHLKLHMSIHCLDGLFQCNACDKQFKKKSYLVRHVKAHMDWRGHKCQMCNKVFASPAQLSKHLKKHSVWRSSKYLCLTCGKSYQDAKSLANHTRRHTGEKPYVCPDCGKAFSDNRLLSSHIRTRKNEKPLECLICDKKFNHSSTLTTHMRTHTGEKPYVCNICSKAFIQSSNLSLHMRTHTGERPYSCVICSKSFASSSTLTYHVRTHTPKLYQCSQCSKAFTRSTELTLHHKRKHSNERPFECSLCDKKFTTASHKNQHMKSHIEKLNKNCGICDKDCTIKAHGKIKGKRKTNTVILETNPSQLYVYNYITDEHKNSQLDNKFQSNAKGILF